MATQKFAYALSFFGDDAIGEFVTNDPQKITQMYNKLTTELYPLWIKDDFGFDCVMETFDVHTKIEGDDFDFKPKDIHNGNQLFVGKLLEYIRKSLKIVRVYMNDVGFKAAIYYDKPSQVPNEAGDFPPKFYMVHGDSEKYWTILTDDHSTAKTYIKQYFNEDGTINKHKLDADISQYAFTYEGY